MRARVLRLSGSTDKVDDGVEGYTSKVVPALREQDGYSGARLLVNRESGEGMSITFWRDEAASKASFEALSSVRSEASSRFGAQSPDAHEYEAVVQHRQQPTEAGNWVRITTLSGDPAKTEAGISHFESQVIPALSQLQGFRGAILFVDRSTGDAIAATVWNSRSDLEASSSDAGPIRAAASDALGAKDPRVENFEVAFAELLTPAGR